jgi:hypothetical protein
MSRVCMVVEWDDVTIEITARTDAYLTLPEFGFCIPSLPDAIRQRTGYDTPGAALDAAIAMHDQRARHGATV